MATLDNLIKKTGYNDIDEIRSEMYSLIQEGNQIEKEIEIALKNKPRNPFKSAPRKRRFFNFKLKSKK